MVSAQLTLLIGMTCDDFIKVTPRLTKVRLNYEFTGQTGGICLRLTAEKPLLLMQF